MREIFLLMYLKLMAILVLRHLNFKYKNCRIDCNFENFHQNLHLKLVVKILLGTLVIIFKYVYL